MRCTASNFVLVLGLSLALSRSAGASLVIVVYDHGALYVASDSLVTEPPPQQSYTTNKIFQISDTCLACLTGSYDQRFFRLRAGEDLKMLNIRDDLEASCRNLLASRQPLATSMTRASQQASNSFYELVGLINGAGNSVPAPETALAFAGYDPINKSFFLKTITYSTNGASARSAFWGKSIASDAGPLYFQGEANFLRQLFTNGADARFQQLRSPPLSRTYSKLNYDAPIAESELANFILDLFRLHKANAAVFGTDSGHIGEPYVIDKITKAGPKRLR